MANHFSSLFTLMFNNVVYGPFFRNHKHYVGLQRRQRQRQLPLVLFTQIREQLQQPVIISIALCHVGGQIDTVTTFTAAAQLSAAHHA